MAISSSLGIALTGLRSTQEQLAVTSSNVANADTVGYSRRTLSTSELSTQGRTYGVDTGTVNRQINVLVQKQWRTANANSSYAETRLESLDLLNSYFGGPGDDSSLTSVYGDFTDAMQTLATTPDSVTNRTTAVASAQTLASTLNTLSDNVQTLRQNAETGLGDAVTTVNSLLSTISDLDQQVIELKVSGASTAAIEDKRDAAIDELSSYMDIQVADRDGGGVTISTANGTTLFNGTPVQLSFDAHGAVDADNVYSTDPDQRSLGTITVSSGPGVTLDLFASGSIRSGKIAALKELRDETLVEAQNQLDTIAATLSQAVGTDYQDGTYVADDGSGNSGYAVDVSSLTEGNTVTVDYKDGSGVSRTLTFVATNGSTAVDDGYTPALGDSVYALDISSGATDDIATQMNNAVLSSLGLTATLSGGALTVVDSDSSAGSATLDGVSAAVSADGLQSGSTALPLFVDTATGEAYTGLSDGKSMLNGLAGRLAVNPVLIADPSYLVSYASDTPSGDGSRPQAILDALADHVYTYSSETGIGSKAAPYSSTFDSFLAQVVSTQGAQYQTAQQVSDGQSVVTQNLEDRYASSRDVDMDTEIAALITLQTAYAANARVMSVAKEMMDTLLNTFN